MLVLFVVFVVTFFLNFLSVDTCTLYDFAFFTFAIFTVRCISVFYKDVFPVFLRFCTMPVALYFWLLLITMNVL